MGTAWNSWESFAGRPRSAPTPADAVRRAAERAWQFATASDDEDPLLAALRAAGTASSHELSDELGRPVADVRAGLRELVAAGLAQRTGHARGTRYHA